MTFNLICAVDKNNGIGINNDLPWKLSGDMNYFKNTTTKGKNVCIMGRNTWESIPQKFRPLQNRINIIVSNTLNTYDIEEKYENTIVVSSLESGLNICFNSVHMGEKTNLYDHSVWVIGGETLYNEAIKHPDCYQIYMTKIYQKYECDKFFPKLEDHFILTSVSRFNQENNVHYRFLVYTNNNIDVSGDLCLKKVPKWQNLEETQYLNALRNIMENGSERIDRTKVGTKSLFGLQFKYNLDDTFPILTTRSIFMRGIFEEFMLYLRGQTDNGILNEKKIHIWDGNTTREFLDSRGLTEYPEGDMGETYGFNFRNFGGTYVDCKTKTNDGFDQLAYVIDLIKNDPTSRRIIINLWNPKTLKKAALPSCLCQYQFWVDVQNNRLNLQIYIRSSDFFLANNWNTCTGALFVHLLCNLNGINLTPGELTVVTGDTHIYNNHLDCVLENLENEPKPFPKLLVKCKKDNIEDFTWEDIKLIGYSPTKTKLKPTMAI